jgi:hypothetical protein
LRSTWKLSLVSCEDGFWLGLFFVLHRERDRVGEKRVNSRQGLFASPTEQAFSFLLSFLSQEKRQKEKRLFVLVKKDPKAKVSNDWNSNK